MIRAGLSFAVWMIACSVQAHPLGNNTVSRQAGILVSPDHIRIRYLVDMAEIPTLLAAQVADVNGDGRVSPSEWDGYAAQYAEQIQAGVRLTLNGRETGSDLGRTEWTLEAGAAGLSTLRLETHLVASHSQSGRFIVHYRDVRHPEESGWKEVIAVTGPGVRLMETDVPHSSGSHDLTRYPGAGFDMANTLSARMVVAFSPSEPDRGSMAEHQTGRSFKGDDPLSLDVKTAVSQSWALFRLGVHHIATGWDHLVFLLGLVVAQTSLRRLAGVITAFTAAHSLTLGLAAAHWVSLPGAWVEPAIALSITYVGLANLSGYNHGAALAFAFGLVHGFGFAGALSETLGNTSSGDGQWLWGLAAFNIGIETFQLLLVLAVLPLIRGSAILLKGGVAYQMVSLAVMVAGLGWFLVRI